MSYVDALDRISQIQGQLAALTSSTGSPSTTAATPDSSGSGSTFATQLAQAQDVAPATTGEIAGTPETTPAALSTGALTGTAAPSTSAATGGVGATPQAASGLLTSSQQQFAARLASATGLDPGVVDSWVLAEESGGAATSRQSANNNDWLNIGYTDSATYGASDSVWSDPVTAADATAGWLAGKDTIPGYGTASSGVQAILQTVGQAPSSQISAIQGSGW